MTLRFTDFLHHNLTKDKKFYSIIRALLDMTNYITKEGLEELKNELKNIVEVELPKALESINRALAEGDLRENSALDSAKLERDKLVARQNEIDEVLSDYQIITENEDDGSKIVKIGSTVKIQYLHDNSMFELKIVGVSESDAISGKISNESPLAQALLGKKEGFQTTFKAGKNDIDVKVLEVIS